MQLGVVENRLRGDVVVHNRFRIVSLREIVIADLFHLHKCERRRRERMKRMNQRVTHHLNFHQDIGVLMALTGVVIDSHKISRQQISRQSLLLTKMSNNCIEPLHLVESDGDNGCLFFLAILHIINMLTNFISDDNTFFGAGWGCQAGMVGLIHEVKSSLRETKEAAAGLGLVGLGWAKK